MSCTEVIICFDTEDFTSCPAADGIRNTAKLLEEEGIRANYNMVGLLSKQLIAWRRFDVLDALQYHEISFHSKAHSLHPTLAEYADIEDYDLAHAITVREELEGMGMVRAATGATELTAACPPGSNMSYVAEYVYAENGIGAYNGGSVYMHDGSAVWMCGLLQMQYNICLESTLLREGYDPQNILKYAAARKRIILYNHPHMIRYTTHWDVVNYYRGNTHAWGEWDEAPERPAYDIICFYERLRTLVRMMKEAKNEDGTPMFRFVTIGDVLKEEKRDRFIRREAMPVYLSALQTAIAENTLTPIVFSNLGVENISLSECLYAAATMLTKACDTVDVQDRILKGFLAMPIGSVGELVLSRDTILQAARSIDFTRFLPTSFETDQGAIGPLDLLLALLEAIVHSTQMEFTITPKPQQPNLDGFPALRDQNLKGAWIFWDALEDTYVSERQRLQAWTIHN